MRVLRLIFELSQDLLVDLNLYHLEVRLFDGKNTTEWTKEIFIRLFLIKNDQFFHFYAGFDFFGEKKIKKKS